MSKNSHAKALYANWFMKLFKKFCKRIETFRKERQIKILYFISIVQVPFPQNVRNITQLIPFFFQEYH